MMNLLGCTKENFYNLMKLMNYRKDKEETDTYIFLGEKRPKNKKFDSKKSENPFSKLLNLNLKQS